MVERETSKVKRLLIVSLLFSVAVAVAVAVAIVGDDHKPVKVPQPVLEWATTTSGLRYRARGELNSGLFGSFVQSASKKWDELPYRVNVVESGKTVVQYESKDRKTLNVRWVDPDWCAREFGHAWKNDAERDGLTLGFTDSTITTATLLPFPDPDPCRGRNYTQNYTCRICKLKKAVKHTCKVDDEQTTYERPVKKP